MKKFFPLTKRTTTLFVISLLLVVSAGFAATGASASVLSSIGTGLATAYNAVWAQPEPAVAGATVSTDKPDYAVGETVQITGAGFGANDVVTLQVTDIGSIFESVAASGYESWTVNADSSGSFTASWLVG